MCILCIWAFACGCGSASHSALRERLCTWPLKLWSGAYPPHSLQPWVVRMKEAGEHVLTCTITNSCCWQD